MSSAALSHQKPLLLLSSYCSPSQAQPAADAGKVKKQDGEADAFKRHSMVDGVGFIPPSNAAYSLFCALNFLAGLMHCHPMGESFSFFISLNVSCDPFGPGDLQHHKPLMLFGEAGLAVAALCVCLKPCWQCCAISTG